jgi:hypothetical protein
MPRKSKDAYAIDDLCVDVRRRMPPRPPPELSDGQQQIWRDTVGSLPGDWFTRAAYPVLTAYCRHVARARLLEAQIAAFEMEWTAANGGLERLSLLLQMAQRETKSVLDCARMLRLGPHQLIAPRSGYRRLQEMPLAGEAAPWAPTRRQLPAAPK